MRKDFYIFRHGETDYNKEKRWQGSGIDAELNENGMKQAEKLIENLVGKNVQIIYSSGLRRAIKTAEIVAAELGVETKIITDLHEGNLGQTEGMLKSEVAYNNLINSIYTNTDIARIVMDGAANGGYSFLLMSLWNHNLKLTEEQKAFAVNEAMNKIGTARWQQSEEEFSKKLDDMGINDDNTTFINIDGCINPIGQKSGAQYMNYMFSTLSTTQAHGTGEFDIRYHILRNPNWSLDEKQKLIMDFWYDDKTDHWDITFPGGETKRQIFNRMHKVLESLLHTKEKVIGIASHGAAIRYLLLGLGYRIGKMENCQMFHLVYEDGKWSVED